MLSPHQLTTASRRHLEAGRLQDAEPLLRKLLSLDRDNAWALAGLGRIALETGHVAAAVDLLGAAVAHNSGDIEALAGLGGALVAVGRRAEGIQALTRALQAKPSMGSANRFMGSVLLQDHDFVGAQRHLDKAVKKNPRDVEAMVGLGLALAYQTQHVKAVQCLRKAIRLAPGHVAAHLNLAGVLAAQGHPEEGIEALAFLATSHPDDVRVNFEYAAALARAGRKTRAIAVYRHVLDLAPEQRAARNNLAVLLMGRGALDEALEHLDSLEQGGDAVSVRRNRAVVLETLGRVDEACAIYHDLLETSPDDLALLEALATVQHMAGRFALAADTIRRMRELSPDSIPAFWLTAINGKCRALPDNVERMRALAADPRLSVEDRSSIFFSLGAMHQDLKEDEAAFSCYAKANALARSRLAFDPQVEERWFASVARVFQPEVFQTLQPLGSASARPVFIVGMPRSGTSLVEQIIAAHPLAAGAGELSDMEEMSIELADLLESRHPYPHCVPELTATVARELGERYLHHLEVLAPEALRVTDKMPGNFRHLGLIAVLFPNARVIHCRRDPRATCLSIYFQRFTEPLAYAFDLYEVGRYHRIHDAVMERWHTVLPLPILEIDYEEIIADQAAASRRLLEFCDLPWDESVLRFHEAGRSVSTASAWQVRQPIYNSSVSLWQRFARHLEPLERGLAGEPR